MRLALVALILVACNREPAPSRAPEATAAPAATSSSTAPAAPATANGAPATANAAPATANRAPLKCADIQSCVAKCPLGNALPPCAAACEARLTPEARGYYDVLQTCMLPSCVANNGPCSDPGALGCKMCAMSHCASQASSCLLH